MNQAGERYESRSINWVAVALLGIVFPTALVAVTALVVQSRPHAPPGDTPAAVAQRIGAAPAPAAGVAAAPAKAQANAKPEGKPTVTTEANPAVKAETKPEAKPEAKPDAKPESKPETKPAALASGADKGKAVYTANCAVCHAAGVAGAPKFGDKAAWAPRIKEGNAALHRTAIKGIRAMPPKGGNASLPDEDVKAAVDYLIAAAK